MANYKLISVSLTTNVIKKLEFLSKEFDIKKSTLISVLITREYLAQKKELGYGVNKTHTEEENEP